MGRIRRLLEILGFLVIFAVSFLRIHDVLRPENRIDYLFKEDEDTEVLFLGSSHVYTGIFPLRMWEEYGFTSSLGATSQQSIPVSYYLLKEVLRHHHPRVVALDVFCMSKEFYAGKTSNIQLITDAMPLFSPVRLECLLDLYPKANKEDPFLSIFFPIGMYHTRWTELKESDFHQEHNFWRGVTLSPDVFTGKSSIPQMAEESREIPDGMEDYLDKIRGLCEESGTELLLFILPYGVDPDNAERQEAIKNDLEVYRSVELYAEKNGIRFVNFFREQEQMRLDPQQDFRDDNHLNFSGGGKISRFLGKYLAETCALPDHRQDPAYAVWNEDAAQFEERVARIISKAAQRQ